MRKNVSDARKTFFIVATMGLVCVVLELVLPVFYFATVGDFMFRRALPPIFEADQTRCYRVKANFDFVHHTNEFEIKFYTNSIGLQTGEDHREFLEEQPEEVHRILTTDPSFVFGWGANL